MDIRYFDRIEDDHYSLKGVWQLLCKYDQQFIPPLSARENTFQSELNTQSIANHTPVEYFEILKQQSFLIATSQDKVIGFMSFRKSYVCEDLNDNIDTMYITTIIVDEDYRGQGITTTFYKEIFKLAISLSLPITTRTWSTNESHISVLSKLGFNEIKRIVDGRGPGIDTVYYRIKNKEIAST